MAKRYICRGGGEMTPKLRNELRFILILNAIICVAFMWFSTILGWWLAAAGSILLAVVNIGVIWELSRD